MPSLPRSVGKSLEAGNSTQILFTDTIASGSPASDTFFSVPESLKSDHVPLKYSLPCYSWAQIHKLRTEDPDTRSFLRGLEDLGSDFDRHLSRAEQSLSKAVGTMNQQTDRLRDMVFAQMLSGIDQKVADQHRAVRQRMRGQERQQRATEMTAVECQRFAQAQVDLFEMSTNRDAFMRRMARNSAIPASKKQELEDREKLYLAACQSRLDRVDIQSLGPCPKIGTSDSEVKEEIRGLIDLI